MVSKYLSVNQAIGDLNSFYIMGVDNSFLNRVPPRFWENKKFVLEMVSVDGDFLQLASNKLQDCEEIVEKAIDNNPSSIKHASERLQLKFKNGIIFTKPQGNNFKNINSNLERER